MTELKIADNDQSINVYCFDRGRPMDDAYFQIDMETLQWITVPENDAPTLERLITKSGLGEDWESILWSALHNADISLLYANKEIVILDGDKVAEDYCEAGDVIIEPISDGFNVSLWEGEKAQLIGEGPCNTLAQAVGLAKNTLG